MTLGRGWPRSGKSPNIPQKNSPSQISFPDVPGIYRPRHPGGRDSGSKGRTKTLQVFFKFNRRLLGDLCRCALRFLSCYFEIVTGSALSPGVIAAIQTFGDRINLHLHFLVTEGGVDEAGVFHKIPRIDDSRLAEIFAREAPAMLVRKKLLSQEWAERILSWPHSGFNVHSHIFIARVTSHIPDKGQVMLRYYGLYANAHIHRSPEVSVSYPDMICGSGFRGN
jgi:hypothetical protein